MSSSNIKNILLSRVRGKLGRDLTENEKFYVNTSAEQVNPADYKSNLDELLTILEELILTDIHTARKKKTVLAEPHRFDIQEMLKEEMKKEPGFMNDTPSIDAKLPRINTHAFMGITDIRYLQKLFNPSYFVSKAYFILDRRYSIQSTQTNHKFTWMLSAGGVGRDQLTTATSIGNIRNIIGIEFMPFRLPRAENAVISSNRISVAIDELSTQSYIANEENRHFHALFKISQDSPVSAYDPIILQDLSGDTTKFDFSAPVQTQLSSITLSFGNPFRPLYFDPDRLTATISATGVQTLLTFAQAHFMQVGDYVIISGFTTDNPSEDNTEIEFLNDKDGWSVSALTSSTLTIDVDISGLAGSITSNPHNIYLESKRFVVPLMLKYLNT